MTKDSKIGESLKGAFHRKPITKDSIKAYDASFNEADHPRGEGGKFSSGGGGGGGGGNVNNTSGGSHRAYYFNKYNPEMPGGGRRGRYLVPATKVEIREALSDLSKARGEIKEKQEHVYDDYPDRQQLKRAAGKKKAHELETKAMMYRSARKSMDTHEADLKSALEKVPEDGSRGAHIN